MIIKVSNKPICVGAGLVALDIVINDTQNEPLKLFAGGSCGNVLTILSFFDWEAFPLARLKENNASKQLITDLKRWNVNTKMISQTLDGSTPIIIQKIRMDKNGNSKHDFQFKNPETREWLPSYKPILGKSVNALITKIPKASVFYFDRVNRSSIDLAKYYKEQGSLIYFEPSSLTENKQFHECIELAHIIKFSNERIKDYSSILDKQRVPLEIVTFGKDGIQYRYSHKLNANEWISLPSYETSKVVDTAGSGDWFSAGLISILGKNGVITFEKCTDAEIRQALDFGQAFGALNCYFEGARGLMYNLSKTEIIANVYKMQKNEIPIVLGDKKNNLFEKIKINISSLY
ncbi:MAG TPA: PfkB family carbohydrate kinase [Saprospiraceae bacterium]|jgi:fructokinase|nr:PfkB family carbohydrate kinase [Saprospiraceae bacterium]HMT71460.1 PfkB family carbohydrate kinase [Saprospiraceae bacterium]